MKLDSKSLLGMVREYLCAHRLAGLCLAQADGMGPRRGAAEEMVKSDDSVNLRPRDVQLLGDHGDGSGWNVTEGGLDGVQYFEERARSLTVLGHDASNRGSLLRR